MARLSDCSPDRRLTDLKDWKWPDCQAGALSRWTDLEVEDDGPDEAQRQLGVAVHDVLGPDVDQLDLQQGQSGATSEGCSNVSLYRRHCQ